MLRRIRTLHRARFKHATVAVPGVSAIAVVFALGHAAPRQQQATLSATGSFFAVSVADLPAAAKWYTDHLGMKQVMAVGRTPPIGGIRVLESDGLVVELIARQGSTRPSVASPDEVRGFTKVGIMVRDFDRVASMIKASGVEIVAGPFPARRDARANVVIRDLEGNLIQLFGDYSRR